MKLFLIALCGITHIGRKGHLYFYKNYTNFYLNQQQSSLHEEASHMSSIPLLRKEFSTVITCFCQTIIVAVGTMVELFRT